MTPRKFDDGNLIWFDYNEINWNELDNLDISNFDVFNIPFKSVELENYMSPTFFKCPKSSTGYCAMFLNKNREIYKTGVKTPEEFNTKYNS